MVSKAELKQVGDGAGYQQMMSNYKDILTSVMRAEKLAYACISRDGTVRHGCQKFTDFLNNYLSDSGKSGSISHDKTEFPSLNIINVLENFDIRLDYNHPNMEKAEILDYFEKLFVNFEKTGLVQSGSFLAFIANNRQIEVNSICQASDYIIVTARDMTDYHRYRQLFDVSMAAATAGFWSFNFLTQQFTYSESVLARLTESEITNIKKNGVWAIICAEDLPRIRDAWLNIFNHEEHFDFKYRVITERFGLMWQHSIGRIERDETGRAISATAFVMDISEQIDTENRLLDSEKISKARSNFLARISHEIRTPLNAIIGMTDSLRQENLSVDIDNIIGNIESAANGLDDLVSSALDHARLMSNAVAINSGLVSVQALIEPCRRLWAPQIEAKGLKFNVTLDPQLPENFHVDMFRIQQCINNLLSNALKFTQEGRISLVLSQTQIKGQAKLVIAVRDEGIGLNSYETAQIFDDFSQADQSMTRAYDGAGLGLSITKQLVELMGGSIVVKSSKNSGSTFMLILPLKFQDNVETDDRIKSELITQSYAGPDHKQSNSGQISSKMGGDKQSEHKQNGYIQDVQDEIVQGKDHTEQAEAQSAEIIGARSLLETLTPPAEINASEETFTSTAIDVSVIRCAHR